MRLFSKQVAGVVVGKGWVEDLVKACAGELALVQDRIVPEAFLQFCFERMPADPNANRDTRRQRLVRAMRRMDERGDLPFKVKGDVFVLP